MANNLSEWQRRVALDFAQACPLEPAPLRPFIVRLKCGPGVLSEWGAMGPDSATVKAQHDDICELGQYIEVVPADRKEEPLPVMVVRQELETAKLRDLLPPQYSDEELAQADADYLASQKERDRRRLAETCDLERGYVARRGWAL